MDIASLKSDKTISIIKKAAQKTGAEIYIIGGILRDIALDQKSMDYDFVVFGDLNAFTGKLSELLKRPLIRIGSKGKEVVRIIKNTAAYDFTQSKGATISDDIKRRDFTMNALAYSLKSDEVIDILAAVDDIDKNIIRMVSVGAFDDDPLRMMRAFRFQAELKFDIEEATLKKIAEKKHLIKLIAGERIREELFKILDQKDSYETVRAMSDCGILYEVFVELKDSIGCEQNEYHHLDVMEHTLLAYKYLEDIIERLEDYFPALKDDLNEFLFHTGSVTLLKYALLLHDVAKPHTRAKGENGRVHFYSHCEVGEKIADEINKRLRLSNKSSEFVCKIIRRHLGIVPFLRMMDEGGANKKSILRYFMRLGKSGVYVIIHNLADLMASRGIKRASKSEVIKVIDLSNIMLDVYFNEFMVRIKYPPLINGRYLIEEFGLTPSPFFKDILDAVYKKQIDGEIKTVKEAASFVKTLI
jgi:poly(A) polymerase